MMKEVTATIEDYLGLLLILERDHVPATGSFLARQLNVSAPTVTNTFKRMIRDGLIDINEEKHANLTEEGRQVAESVMRRHMLTEWLLTNTLDIPWSETHHESHMIEHTLSQNVEKKLAEYIKYVKTCPHGNPLPGNETYVEQWPPLSSFKIGDRGILRRIHELGEDNEELLKYFEAHHFMPGTEFTVTQVLDFNQTMTVETLQESLTLGQNVVKYLYAERI